MFLSSQLTLPGIWWTSSRRSAGLTTFKFAGFPQQDVNLPKCTKTIYGVARRSFLAGTAFCKLRKVDQLRKYAVWNAVAVAGARSGILGYCCMHVGFSGSDDLQFVCFCVFSKHFSPGEDPEEAQEADQSEPEMGQMRIPAIAV